MAWQTRALWAMKVRIQSLPCGRARAHNDDPSSEPPQLLQRSAAYRAASRDVAEFDIGWGVVLFSQALWGLLPLSRSCLYQESDNHDHRSFSGLGLLQEGENSNFTEVSSLCLGSHVTC